MKKWLITLCAFALLVGFIGPGNVSAQFGNKVADTPHNLREGASSPMGLTDWGEICVYCHTPHNNNTDIDVPLWNRGTPAGPYTMYSSSTLDMDIASSPQGGSLACLSCHDNTIALDQVINVPANKSGTAPSGLTIDNCTSSCHVGNGAGGLNFVGTVLDTDLGNDHPISVTYDPSKDPKFHPASNGKVGNLPLYGPNKNLVECASCHNPHDNSNRPFLRMSNENSAMCLACHDI
jgi:predicted CXXCH cytochrome family protein